MCDEQVTVRNAAVEWLKKHYPTLCEKSGLCERIGGRLYTRTFLPLSTSAQANDMCREHHAALQRIGTALGLEAGSDLHRLCVPAIERLRAAAPAADPEQRTRLREHMGQVLSASLASMCDDDATPDWCDSRHIDELLDELMPVIRVHFDPELSDPSWSALYPGVKS